DVEAAGEHPQEMEWAEPDRAGRAIEIDALVRVRVDEERGFDRSATIARPRLRRAAVLSRYDLDETAGECDSDLLEAEIAATFRDRLRELAKYHQLGKRRHAAARPNLRSGAERLEQCRRQRKGQTFIAEDMIMGAHVLVAGMADEQRTGDELEESAARAAPQAALAHVGEREIAMLFGERCVAGPDVAPIVDDGDRLASKQRRDCHAGMYCPRAPRANSRKLTIARASRSRRSRSRADAAGSRC